MAAAMPSSSRRRNSAGAVPARPASARAVLAVVTLSPPLADHGTLAYRRSGTHAYRISGSTAGGVPMATKLRPLGGRAVRPLAGRPVMITGAASGIGRSLARRLSGLGSPVAIADIDEAGLKETARTLPGPVLVRVLYVRDAADQRRFAAEVREWLASLPDRPHLAAVFNNAGVAVASSVLDADPDDDEWLRQINFDGVVNGTRAFLPILAEQDDGVIVNTSSVFGLVGMPYQSAYCASKFAVRGFT